MGDDDDGVVLLELAHEVFDGQGGDGVKGGARLVHQQYLGFDGNGTGDAQSLLLSTREGTAGNSEAVFDLIPKVGGAQGALHHLLLFLLGDAALQLQAGDDVVLDGHGGEWVGALEDHADGAAERNGVNLGAVDVLAIEEDLAGAVGAGGNFVHAVKSAQDGGFTAAGGSDKGHHRARCD